MGVLCKRKELLFNKDYQLHFSLCTFFLIKKYQKIKTVPALLKKLALNCFLAHQARSIQEEGRFFHKKREQMLLPPFTEINI
jgi:hypothetical protein